MFVKASSASEKPIFPLFIDNISLIRNGRFLLNDITFKLDSGGITILLGANGAGKTLLLKICHGLLHPSNGKISWQEKDAKYIKKKQAMVFQRTTLLKRSVAANIDYAMKLQGITKVDRQKYVEESLYLTGLQHLKNRSAVVLSGGEQQRLALARAWVVRPKVLFLDEPTANIDPCATAAVEELIKRFNQAGVKIILSTHDLNQAKRLADEVLFLHQGQLLEHSTAIQFFNNPGSPIAKSFIHGELHW